jgi:chromosome segregation ATPase
VSKLGLSFARLTLLSIADLVYCSEREVKKANRDLNHELSTHENPLARIDAVQKKYTQLLTDMKRLEREYQKSKKRADTLQKEKDSAKSELNKTNSLKEKLEKLSRETSNENRKLRVRSRYSRKFNIPLLTRTNRPMYNAFRMSKRR